MIQAESSFEIEFKENVKKLQIGSSILMRIEKIKHKAFLFSFFMVGEGGRLDENLFFLIWLDTLLKN